MIKEFCENINGKSSCDDCNNCSVGSIIKEHDDKVRADAIEEYRQRLNNAFEPVEDHEQMELEVVIADVNRLAKVLKEQK